MKIKIYVCPNCWNVQTYLRRTSQQLPLCRKCHRTMAFRRQVEV